MPVSERHTAFLNAALAGEKGRMAKVLHAFGDIRLTAWEDGKADFLWTLDQRFDIGDGSMFGGYIAAVADNVLSVAALTVLDRSDLRFRTSQLQTNFFRPLTGETVTIKAEVTNKSQRLVHVRCGFFTSEGKLAAESSAVQSLRTHKS